MMSGRIVILRGAKRSFELTIGKCTKEVEVDDGFCVLYLMVHLKLWSVFG